MSRSWPLVGAASMRALDRHTILALGVPADLLMELAGRAVADAALALRPPGGELLVVCGAGNNGGDGLVAARHLALVGAPVRAALLVPAKALRGLALENARRAERAGVRLEGPRARMPAKGVVVDALFGTGLDRPLAAPWSDVVRAINERGVPVVAVDLPSGLSGDSAAIPGEAVEAAVTVTFAAPKLAHVLPPACWRCGEVAVGDIGIPPWVLEAHASVGMLEAADVAGWLPLRPVDAHKGRFGHLVVIAGRVGRAGAAALAARAGVLAGAGLVTVATAAGAAGAVQAAAPEAMVDLLPADADGVVTGDGLDGLLAKATAIAVGPGLGLGDGPARLLADLLAGWRGPLLVDADALTLLAGRPQALAGREAPTVATPHPGELGRLLGTGTGAVTADRLAAARAAAGAAGATVLAKGARTIVAEPDGRALVNPTGCAGLATGGSGDVLAGVVGALLAQGLPGREAAAVGAWLHGRAAELAAERFPGAIPAGELAAALPGAERELREAQGRA